MHMEFAKYLLNAKYFGGEFHENTETIGTKYFALSELPENLAEEKCNKEQIELCFKAHASETWVTQFD